MNERLRRKKTEQNRRKSWFTRMLVLMILACTPVSGAPLVYAKYVQISQRHDSVTARAFYFTSDLLDDGVHEIPALEDDGTAVLEFHLMNHEDQLRYSDVAVDYQVTYTEITDGTEEGEGKSVQQKTAGEMVKGTMAAGENQDVLVQLPGLQAGSAYRVTASATSPYTKTLTGVIRVQSQNAGIQASVADKGAYIEVIIQTADSVERITLNCDAADLIPDNTDSLMEEMGAGNSGMTAVFSLDANASHAFRLFKSSDRAAVYEVFTEGEKVTVYRRADG